MSANCQTFNYKFQLNIILDTSKKVVKVLSYHFEYVTAKSITIN